MLVLGRKENEKLLLTLTKKNAEELFKDTEEIQIEICVVRLQHNKLRLGIDAPDEIVIMRTELLNEERNGTF